ncbi:WXG100 family type VII secretion target [Streptomyces sp. TP-A0874]|uniref:WXG100 family type VII secretion target n=1 Tax=Streptomyces sp. TP-A0874 TaxID=549819 RepID=UPI000853AC94|nr:WXG100 family type VII secretion target [Streptomyces sp. TP-A0874]
MTTTAVTYETVTTASEDIRRTANDIKEQLEGLHRRVTRVVNTWEGEAKTAFHETQTDWTRNAEGLHSSLLQISRALMTATEGYRATDKGAAAQFRI